MSKVDAPHILYLHGFNSSPLSHKAQAMLAHMHARNLQHRLTIATIPARPSDAETCLDSIVKQRLVDSELAIVGSSLGGFYATWLAQRYALRAALINPAVRPHERLREFIGINENFHTGESWEFTQQDVDTLERMTLDKLDHPEKFKVLLQTGDETLDYCQAESYYRGAELLIETGGDHSFQGFEQHIDAILAFCGIDSH